MTLYITTTNATKPQGFCFFKKFAKDFYRKFPATYIIYHNITNETNI